MSESRMLKGTLILSAATFFTKFIGMLFVIPLNAIVGKEGGFLYGYAYTPYSIILSISTVGVPLAVSKFVSKYNAIGDYYTGRRLFRSGLLLMTLTGFLGFVIMYGFAPFFAYTSVSDSTPATLHSLTQVMRVTSFALLLVPAMSLIRGYFQGFQSMGPTATSQTLEQIVRVLFGLLGAYFVMQFFNRNVSLAVSYVTFGAFMGALAGLIMLIRYWIKRKPYLDQMVERSTNIQNLNLTQMYKEIISYAIPFVAVGLSNQVYFLIDQVTVAHFLDQYFKMPHSRITDVVADLFTYDQKIVLIPVSLATALGLSVVPSITESFAEGRQSDMQIKITQAFQFTIFFTLPAAVGLSILGYMVYGLLYGGFDHDLESIKSGGDMLQWYAPTAIVFAVFSVTAAILQGINKQKITILSLGIGILLKMVFTPVSIRLFGVNGPIVSTDIGYLASIWINLFGIQYSTGYRYTFIARRFLLISIFTIIMSVGLGLTLWISGGSIPNTRLHALVFSVIGVMVGGGIYFLLALKSGLLKQVMGARFTRLLRSK